MYPHRLREVRDNLQYLRGYEPGWAGLNPCLNPSLIGKEKDARLCGALDSLLDMDGALSKFWRKIGSGQVPTHLECLGFLPALSIQQDCIQEIYTALGRGKIKWPDNLDSIREMRNRISGHPAFAARQTPQGSAMWKADSITADGFEMIIYFVSGSKHQYIGFRNFIQENNEGLANLLQAVLDQLIQPEN